MLHWNVSRFTTHNIEDLNHFRARGVNDGKHIRTERNVSLVQELNSKALALWRGDKFTLVRIDIEVLAGIDQSEILCSLDDKEDNIFDVKHERRTPVHGAVNIALRGCAHNQVIMLHAHVDNSFSEVEIIVHFMEAVVDADSVFRVEDSFDMGPLESSIDDMSKYNLSISTCT